MAVLESQRKSAQRQQQPRRKISGVLSSFLDAFRCHVSSAHHNPSRSGGGGSGKSKIQKLSLKQMMHQKAEENEQEQQRKCKCPEQEQAQMTMSKKMRVDSGGDLRWIVAQLQHGGGGGAEAAASEVRKMSRSSAENRVEFARLGAIPLLVNLLDTSTPGSKPQISSLLALLNLAIGNNRNKESIVAAGAVGGIVRILSSGSSSEQIESAAAALLSLSALDSNKPIIGSSGAVPHVVRVLEQGESSRQGVRDSIRVLYNLSLAPQNAAAISTSVPLLLSHLRSPSSDSDDKLLAILGNLIECSDLARRSIASSIDLLLSALRSYNADLSSPSPSATSSSNDDEGSTSTSSSSSNRGEYSGEEYSRGSLSGEYPAASSGKVSMVMSRCQERLLYVLMVVSHQSGAARQAMVACGAITLLLEVSLLGSAIAQRRAGRILDCLREDRMQRSVRPVSAPLSIQSSRFQRMSSASASSVDQKQQQQQQQEEDQAVSEERRAVNLMVRQSLQRNMDKMVERARLPSVDLDNMGVARSCGRMMLMDKRFGSSSSCNSLPV